MNILEAIKSRKSIRQFTGEHVKEEELKSILELASRAPSSVNGQQISLVYTRNKDIIEQMSILCGGQKQVKDCDVFITIVGDFYRASSYLNKNNIEFTDEIHRLREVAATDAGIMAYLINLAAMGYGYGSTIIGGIKQSPVEVAKLLNLPENTFPMLGITIGEPTKESLLGTPKPRIDFETFAMENVYNKEVQQNAVENYEVKLDSWFKSIGVSQPLFGDVIKRFYSK